MLTFPIKIANPAASEIDLRDVGGGEYGSGGGVKVTHFNTQGRGGSYMGVRVDTSSKCSLSSTNTTITQHMKMTMETSEEVRTGQEVIQESSFIILKGREEVILTCAPIQAQNAHFPPPTPPLRSY
jgi:hypothetical protein